MSRYSKLSLMYLLNAATVLASVAGAVDHAGPYRPYSAEFDGSDSVLHGLDEAAYGRMSLEDPVLKRAYRAVFGSSIGGGFYNLPPEVSAALADLRKRGDTVTPMLLQLMDKNKETGFESSVLASVAAVGSIQLDPYLDYARNLLRERTHSMSANLAGCASILLASHGTKEDAKLLKWVMETRPWLAASVKQQLDELNRRLNFQKQETRPPLKDRPAANEPPKIDFRNVGQKTPTVIAEKGQESTRWVAWFLAILVAGGLFRLLFKKRK